MQRTLLTLILAVFTTFTLEAQKKSELIAEISDLKSKLDSVSSEVAKAKRNEGASLARAESYEIQVTELQTANATLLKNLNNFAEVSNKNSDNVNTALARVRAKEGQLKAITDAFASNDSTAIVILTSAKQTLGENAKISVAEGIVTINSDLTTLFEKDTSTNLVPESEAWIGKVADILVRNPKILVTIEGLNITGDLDIATKQAGAVSNVLVSKFSIEPTRIVVQGKDGNFKEGINLKLHPDFAAFYQLAKENMKN